VLANQVSDLAKELNDYHMVGLGRDVDAKSRETFLKIKAGYRIFNGNADGEFSPLLYRKSRFKLMDFGIFWFSATPDVPSIWTSYAAANRRICTWLRLHDKSADRTFYIYNLHLENGRDKDTLRTASSQILIERIRSREFKDDPVLICGDFNARDTESTITILIDGQENNSSTSLNLTDSWRSLNHESDSEGTFHFWTGKRDGSRIDYIFVSADWEIRDSQINTYSKNDSYPSDHYPISSTLKLK
ncbi:MAG: endonuclease/exonuclease/phosphatase family protein, partial [Calditrichaeota bacterium]|nr:endonuclease/exonuclease/phosphatase family protein [Calditrichota bacterium]